MPITKEQKEQIHTLFKSEDFNDVKRGLVLLEPLVTSEADLRSILQYSKKCSSFSDFKPKFKGYIQGRNYIKVWSLGKMMELGVVWVQKIKSLDLHNLKLVELPPCLNF